jgi:hypothetical protein
MEMADAGRTYADPTHEALWAEAEAEARARPRRPTWLRSFRNPQVACWRTHLPKVVRLLGLSTAMPEEPELRRAVARWQASQGLSADGVLGPVTWRRIWAALGVVPVPAVRVQLPPSGPGYYTYRERPLHRFGRPETIRALQAVGAAWVRTHPRGPRIGIADLSLRGGGPIAGHASHQCGVDVDIRLMRNDGRELDVTCSDPAYSQQLTQELVNLIRKTGPVQSIFFNDPRVRGVTWQPNHHNHLHVRFRHPSGDRETSLSGEGAPRTGGRNRRRFTDAEIKRLLVEYAENDLAAKRKSGDRAACIVMLNIALGRLLRLPMVRRIARAGSRRIVAMGRLPVSSVEHVMGDLERRGQADPPIRVRFVDDRQRTAGVRAPRQMQGSARDALLRHVGTTPGWYAFGLSIMVGYHSALLLVRRTRTGVTIFWLDQFSSGLRPDVTQSLDHELTGRTKAYWDRMLLERNVRSATWTRIWPLRAPR